MDKVSSADMSSIDPSVDTFCQKIDSLIKDPILIPLPDLGSASMFQKTESRPSWERLEDPPTIAQTLQEWHLTRKQAEFAILVLTHFHNLVENRNPEQMLALCLGAPGTGKSQTMLAMLWHMSQHRQLSLREEVATCAFTGGAAMLISTPHTMPMTTCRQFQINLKGPSKTMHSVHVLSNRTTGLLYVFIDEFSFLSYKHLKDIAEQITVGLGERAAKDKPFGGMNFVFFGDYEQLSKPGDYAMYYGAKAEESMDTNDMKTWFSTKIENHFKRSSYDVTATFIGRDLWTSIHTVCTLTVQKRQVDIEDGLRLLKRCQALRDEEFPDEFFDSIQHKAITAQQLTSNEWSDALYIVMRHTLRVHIDFNEAKFQAQKQNKHFIQWRTYDTIHGKQLPQPLQLVVDNIIIDKIPRMQYFYASMPIAFVDNKYFAAGNATNNQGHAISIVLDPREPLDDFSKPFRELVYLLAYILVYVPNAHMDQLYPDLPPKVIPLTPTTQTHRIRLGDNRYKLQNGKNISHVSVSRLGMRWIGVHAVTQYFSQGMSLAGRKCIVDLRIPEGGGPLKIYAQSVLVMLSRHKDDTDWALLHPLWSPGNQLERLQVIDKMRKQLCRDLDLHAELRRIQHVESHITEPALQKILIENLDLAKILPDS